MKHRLISRNVTIDGRRTSIRLEEEMWAAFDEICHREGLTAHALCSLIEKKRLNSNRTSAVRAYIVLYYRLAAGTRTTKRLNGAEKLMRKAERHRGSWDDFPFPASVLRVFDSPSAS